MVKKKSMEAAFPGRKSFATQNVTAVVDFDLKFTYILAGWEGTTHDAVILADALERENGGLRVPEGNIIVAYICPYTNLLKTNISIVFPIS